MPLEMARVNERTLDNSSLLVSDRGRAHYRDSLAIGERLAQSDPGNAGWQRDLAVSYERIGNAQVAQGDHAGALKSYSDSLTITERLAQSDPGNAGSQLDLSVSYTDVGDVRVAQGDLADALKSYRDSLAIGEESHGMV
jgi:tetratricopeptide (TPR) repeat protein